MVFMREKSVPGKRPSRSWAFLLGTVLIWSVCHILPAWAQNGTSPIIHKIDITGNRRIDSGTILNKIGSRVGEPMSMETIRKDIRAIYDTGGYFENVQVESEPVEGGVRLIFRIDEKPIISSITIEGNKELEEGKVRDALLSRIGSPYDLKRIKKDKEAVLTLYQNEGFYFAEVQTGEEDDNNQNKRLTYKIDEGKKVIIGEIFLRGNEHMKSGEIKKKAMETKEHWMLSFLTSAGVFKREILDIDLERIKDYYYSHGYLEVRVGEPEILFVKPRRRTWDRVYEAFKGWGWAENEIAVTIPIFEGEQYRIGKMQFTGVSAVPEETLRKRLSSKDGEVFSSESIRSDIKAIAHAFGEKGYAFTSVSPLTVLNHESRTVDLTWDVEEGNRVFIGEVNIIGNVRTRDNVIRRELRFSEGDQYDIAKIDRSETRIKNTGYFEDVNVSTNRRAGEQVVDLDLKVKEQQTGSLSFGIGASSTQGLIGSFDIRQKNLFGTGREVDLSAVVGGQDSNFNFRFVEPWLFDKEVSLGFNLFKSISDYDSFREQSTGGSVTFGKALDEYSSGSIGFDYENIRFTNVDQNYQQSLTQTQSVFGITFGWRRNTVDNILDPSRGYLARASAKFAGLLGDANFNKYYVSDRLFYKGPWKTTFSVGAEGGFVDVDSPEDIPVSELFFLGGIESLRGFQYRSLGPRNFFGSLIGGRKMVLFNVEYNFPIIQSAGFKGFLFFDAGRAFDPVSETSPTGYDKVQDPSGFIKAMKVVRSPNLTDGDTLKKSWGIGFYWLSPAGPIKIVWANAINPEAFDSVETIQFSLGTSF